MKTSGEFEKEFVDNIIKITGHDLKYWFQEIKSTGITKRNDIIKWLKTDKSFGHVNAVWLTGIFLNDGKLVYQNEAELFENHFKNREQFKRLFHQIANHILKMFPDARMIPKKSYISFTAKREFVAINIKAKEIRVGFDLGKDHPFNGQLEKAKLSGPMPRLSHMIVYVPDQQIDNSFSEFARKSYTRVH